MSAVRRPGRRHRREPVYAATVALGRVLLAGLDLRVRASGTEHVPATGPVVLAANHVSFGDFVLVGRALLGTEHRVRFFCRDDVWGPAPLARAMDAMGHVPVDRAAPAAAYLRGRALLHAGEVVCLFPEAGISAAHVVRSLMPGAVALARETGAPLVPVTLWGGQRLWPQRRSLDEPLPRPTLQRHRTVDVRFHPAVHVHPAADLTGVTRALGHRLQSGLEDLQRLPEHRPAPGERAPWYPAHLGGGGVGRADSVALDRMPPWAVVPTWGPGLALRGAAS